MKLSKDPAGLSPGANTRMLNDKSRAAAAAMAHNQSALNTLSPQNAPRKTPTAPVPIGAGLKQPTQPVKPAAFPQKQQPLPLQQPALPVPNDPIQQMNEAVALQKFLGAPETSDAVTRIRLRNYFKRGDPNAFEPGNDMGQSVMTIMQQYLD